MKCYACHHTISEGAQFCKFCGAQIENPPYIERETALLVPNSEGINHPRASSYPPTQWGQNGAQEQKAYPYGVEAHRNNGPLTQKEFYKTYASKTTKGWTQFLGILTLAGAGLSVVSAFQAIFTYMNWVKVIPSLFDIALFLVLGILLLVKKSWIISLVIVIYRAISWGLIMVLYLFLSFSDTLSYLSPTAMQMTNGAASFIGTIIALLIVAPIPILILIGGILSTRGLYKVKKAYKNYLQTNELPQKSL